VAVASAGHMQVCTSLQTDNHANTPPLHFLQAGCPSCRPTNSVKALKAMMIIKHLRVYCTCLLNDNYFMVMNFINVIIMNFITCQYFDDIF